MSYWRKFILVVLLALSLPIQSFATVSMQCAGAAVPHAEEAPHTMSTAPGTRGNHGDHDSHAASCAACVSCCFGTGMSGVPAVPAAADASIAIASYPLSDVVVSFLTGGIERPPRRIPV